VALMTSLSKAATEAEVLSGAAYFSGLTPRKVITVIETDMVPKTFVAGWFLAVINDKDKELLGQRIIEVPKDLERFESHDARSELIAYVPIGSVASMAGMCHFQTKCSAANSGLFDHLVGRRPTMVKQWDFRGDIPVSGETIASNPR